MTRNLLRLFGALALGSLAAARPAPQDVAAVETLRLGFPPNPLVFLPGQTSGPVIGAVWDPALSPFLSGAQADFIVFGPAAPFNFPTSAGTLLCAGPRALVGKPAGPASFGIPIPADLALVGIELCTQGGSFAPGPAFALANALDVTIGSVEALRIVSCSLGCVSSGTQISCAISNVFLNEELRILFNRPVELSSVNGLTLQVFNVLNGQTPAGTVRLDASDPKQLIWTPTLSFDSSGNPIFGLEPGGTYQLTIPGTLTDFGPFLTDTAGGPNSMRLRCILVASQGVRDYAPGAPSAAVTVDVVSDYDSNGNPLGFDLDVPADGAIEVSRSSPVRIRFDDVMLPSTLLPPQSPSDNVKLELDPDGDLTDASDRTPIAGSFSLSLDTQAPGTELIFQPASPWPAPTGSSPPLRIVVTLDGAIRDLVGNGLANPGAISFVPED